MKEEKEGGSSTALEMLRIFSLDLGKNKPQLISSTPLFLQTQMMYKFPSLDKIKDNLT